MGDDAGPGATWRPARDATRNDEFRLSGAGSDAAGPAPAAGVASGGVASGDAVPGPTATSVATEVTVERTPGHDAGRQAAAAGATLAADAGGAAKQGPPEAAPEPVADLSTLVESAGLQWVETRSAAPDELPQAPRQPMGRPRRVRRSDEVAEQPLTQVETQTPDRP